MADLGRDVGLRPSPPFEVGLGVDRVVEAATMEILLVGTELGPWVSRTDTSDELFALAKSFKQLGHDVTLIVPHDQAYERGGLLVARRLSPLELGDGHAVTLFDAHLASGAKVVLIGMPAGVECASCGQLPVTSATLKAISIFGRAVAAYVEQRAEQSLTVDVVHLFDWPTAIIALAIRQQCQSASCRVVLSLRNSEQLGSFPAALLDELSDPLLNAEELCLGGERSLVRAGLLAADPVLLPSEAEVRALETGRLKADVSARQLPIYAVGVGVDYARINPATNPSLAARYDAEDSRNKATNKTAWLRQSSLSLESRPLLLVPGPVTAEEGGELLLEALEPLLQMELSLSIFASPADDDRLVRAIRRKLEGRQGDASIVELTNEEQIHRAFAAADFVAYPKRDGKGPMASLAAERYGALVIASATSALGERVVDVDAGLTTGTGFLFDAGSVQGFLGAVGRALSAYRSDSFDKLRRRVMRQDCSWDRPARRLLRLYDKARLLNVGSSKGSLV